MLVDNESLNAMQQDIEVVLNYFEEKNGAKYDVSTFDVATKHAIWAKVANNKRYDDDNGNVFFFEGKRLFKQNKNFDFYICGTNDKTIKTALDKVFSKISATKNKTV